MTKRINCRYSKKFRDEAAKLVVEGGVSAYEASRQLALPKSTLEKWVRAFKAGKLGDIGEQQRPLTEIELELDRVKRELAEVKQERDILKNYLEPRPPLGKEKLQSCIIDVYARRRDRQLFGVSVNPLKNMVQRVLRT